MEIQKSNMSTSSIIEKVQRLQKLSTSSNAFEAANAAAMANKLIDQYRLSTADLEISSEVEESIEEDSDYVYQTGKITVWKSQLLKVLTSHYGGAIWNDTSYTTGRKVSRYKLVGRKSDISLIRYMFTWLMTECQRLVDKEAKGNGRIFVSSYCMGFIAGIAEQLKVSRNEVEKTATSAAIIKINMREQESSVFMHKAHKLVKAPTYNYYKTNHSAYSYGHEQGKNMHLGSSLSCKPMQLLKP